MDKYVCPNFLEEKSPHLTFGMHLQVSCKDSLLNTSACVLLIIVQYS